TVVLDALWQCRGRTAGGSVTPACRRLGAELEAMREGERAPAPAATGHPPAPFAAPRGPDELLEWVAELHGPSETPYAGGVFYLSMSFPEEYPMRPPTVLFLTRCFHPNVDEQSGSICLNILKQEWSPLLTVFSTLLSISALLAEPEPEDPLNKEAAHLILADPARFFGAARECTRRHAARPWGPAEGPREGGRPPGRAKV
ncbi:unnamed protein product, partial [Prorocentrum cordatum]